jgi:hypothetical protein
MIAVGAYIYQETARYGEFRNPASNHPSRSTEFAVAM